MKLNVMGAHSYHRESKMLPNKIHRLARLERLDMLFDIARYSWI